MLLKSTPAQPHILPSKHKSYPSERQAIEGKLCHWTGSRNHHNVYQGSVLAVSEVDSV